MATHDYVIANQGFPAFRSDLNNALAAIVSNNSSATEPTTMFAHMIWVDTAADPSVLKIRNADNDAWITIGTINQTGDTFTLTSAVSATTLNTSGQVVFNDAGADVDFRVEGDNDANLLFVDASTDRIGCGTNTPAVKFDVQTASAVGGITLTATTGTNGSAINCVNTGGSSYFGRNNSSGGAFGGTAYATIVYSGGAYPMAFYTNDTERARITSGGVVCINETTQINSGRLCITDDCTNFNPIVIKNSVTQTAGQNFIVFINSAGNSAGAIQHTGTTTVNYATSSDYRLKENVSRMTNALEKVMQLNPVTYTWKEDKKLGQGFIAHELQMVVPDCVTGEKDATEIRQVQVSPAVPATYDEEGNELTPAVEAVYEEREAPVYQGIDTSFLVATLTAAIQELKAELDEAKARIAALETGA